MQKYQSEILFLILFIFMVNLNLKGTLYEDLSSLEKETVDQAMAELKLEPVEDLKQKEIKGILIYTESPFAKEKDILSRIGDSLHKNTTDGAIFESLNIKAGDLYDEDLIKDNEKNLRNKSIRSISVIVPVRKKGEFNENIYLLVVSRDIFSLRPSFSLEGSFLNIEDLYASFGEYNLFGTERALIADYHLSKATHAVGLNFIDPRILKSSWSLNLNPQIIFSRQKVFGEGFYGRLELEKPLRFLNDTWGYDFSIAGGSRPKVPFKGFEVRIIKLPSGKTVERRFHYANLSGRAIFTRSFGSIYKKEVFFGYGFDKKNPSIPKDLSLTDDERSEFIKSVLPKKELLSFAIIGFSYFHNRYLDLYDYDNFKTRELIRLGPELSLSADLSPKILLRGDDDFISPSISLAFTKNLGLDSFINFKISGSARFDGKWSDEMSSFKLLCAMPQISKIFRPVLSARFIDIKNNRNNQTFTLGSDNALRGVESSYLEGTTAVRGNLEFRSNSLKLLSIYAGAVLFYDIGSAFFDWHSAQLVHNTGFGLRIFAPQLSATSLRLDLAFPLDPSSRAIHVLVPSFGAGQAF